MTEEQGVEHSENGADADAAADEDVSLGGVDADIDVETVDVGEIQEHVADSDPEEVAEEIATLREAVGDLELELEEARTEREDFEDRLKRKQAEFQNYKKRQEKRREQERQRATEDLVTELLEVRDNLKRALEQDEGTDIREGVEATFRQLDDVLASENVDPIEPEPGTDVDPQRHEVLLRVESDQPAGTVDDVQRPGYEMAGKVLRPAQVTVAEE
ncbi:nucleotide exchange factor GrpE [Natronomonas halophila]|uniref:nucleotide exchange factor GrpE n=1 Tax=Natronomonas halophila TaxID=2747817 RepID=UPI0015B6D77D|nr:nucleotide exchange factor GrpE [Natronomonas halophila]QLD86670.1 nucleotide exchange factor GrpE [Natronomonas halophila]